MDFDFGGKNSVNQDQGEGFEPCVKHTLYWGYGHALSCALTGCRVTGVLSPGPSGQRPDSSQVNFIVMTFRPVVIRHMEGTVRSVESDLLVTIAVSWEVLISFLRAQDDALTRRWISL
jgi:hypothetical protein